MMDGLETLSTGEQDKRRQEVDGTYSRLETMIRNYGHEKLKLEQDIEGLRNQLKLEREGKKKMALENEDIQEENKRLLRLLDESEKAKSDVEALLLTVEGKQEIICDTLDSLEKEEDALGQEFKGYEEFLITMKTRQLQLMMWIDEIGQQNECLEQSKKLLEEKNTKQLRVLRDLENERTFLKEDVLAQTTRIETHAKVLEDLKSASEKENTKFLEQIAQHTQELTTLQSDYSELQDNLNVTTARANTMSEELATMKKECESLKHDNHKLKKDNEEQISKSTEENVTLKEELNTASSKYEDLYENFKITSESLNALKVNLEACQTECTILKAQDEKTKLDIQQQKTMYEDLVAKLTEDLNQTSTQYEELLESFKRASEDLIKTTESLKASELDSENLKAETKRLKLETEHQEFKKNEELANLKETLNLMNSDFRNLENTSKAVKEKLEKDLDQQRREKRELRSRYQTLKQAVAKMVHQTKKSEISSMSISPAPQPLNQEPVTPTRVGILKQPNASTGESTPRKVTFGPNSYHNITPNDTDDSSANTVKDSKKESTTKRMNNESSSSNDDFEFDKVQKSKKTSPKRMRLTRPEDEKNSKPSTLDNMKSTSPTRPVKETPVRRFIKRGIVHKSVFSG